MAARVEGTERGLDATVGLVIVVASLIIGALAIGALYEAGTTATWADPQAAEIGFEIALFGSIVALGITTLVYLVRVAAGRRSWSTALVGLLLMTASTLLGWLVMSGAA